MPPRPLVSIVTPSYNAAEFIEDTIRSVLAQDYPRIEYLVMDAGSTDGTVEILERYRGRLQFVSEKDRGTADAVNRGFRKAKGEILAWIGADDLYLPGAVSAAVAAFTEDPAAGAVYGGGYWIDEHGRTLGRYPTRAPYNPAMFQRECPVCQPACFMRRKAVEAVGGLDESLQSAFDYDLWIRLSRHHPFRAIPQHLAESRMHSRNKSLGEKQSMFDECIALLSRHYGYVPMHWVYSYISFLRDRTDQFFTPMHPSPRVYLQTLLVGSRYNVRHLRRFWSEWLSGLRARMASPPAARTQLHRIAIDLTPMLPGGDNGGIKLLALDLVRRLAARPGAPELVLLTSSGSHAELAPLDGPNVRRVCVQKSAAETRRRGATRGEKLSQVLSWFSPRFLRFLRDSAVKTAYARLFRPSQPPLLRQLGAELLFCPFTGISFYDPAVPIVAVIADLQYAYYPEFFTPEELHERRRNFQQVCRVASRVVCLSEYTRATVLDQSDLPADRTAVIGIPARAVSQISGQATARVPAGLPLALGRYLLYPANFWRHKNHEMLLIAFGIYRAAHPQSDLKLALTGAPSARRDELMKATRRMGLDDRVVFPGFLAEEDFAGLLAGAAALIFPSLFEGFGMPVLEAMAAGVPVLCANLTSLPEVAAPQDHPHAALLFDPRRPSEIVDAIERLESGPALRAALIEHARRRAAGFLTSEEMAARYWGIFEDAFESPNRSDGVYGVFPDGWTGPRMTVVFGYESAPRHLTLTLFAPEFLPTAEVDIRVTGCSSGPQTHRIHRGQRQTITLDLPHQAGSLELLCMPTFRPGGHDHRQLGCMLESAVILGPEGPPEGEGASSGPARELPREVHAA